MTQSCVKFIYLIKIDTMKNLNTVRISLGLSQYEMAHYLEISRSQLTMYEQGKRDLPTHALVKLAEMELFLMQYATQSKSKPLPQEKAQLQKAQEIFDKHQKEVAFQQLVLEKKLGRLQKKYQHNIRLLAFLTNLEEKNSTANTLEKSWRTIMKNSTMHNIEINGLHHQAKIVVEMQRNIVQEKTNFIDNLRNNITNL